MKQSSLNRNQQQEMEQIYQISDFGGRPEYRQHTSRSIPLRLALLTVCLVVLVMLTQVAARPSELVTKPEQTSSTVAHPAVHNQKRRSVEVHPDEDYDDEVDYERVRRCHEDEDVNELCQRCSKVTKSSIVFPMCCSNEDQTMEWCEAYVYYGIQN